MKKPTLGLTVIIGLTVFNALATTIMYLKLLRPSYNAVSFDPLTLKAYAVGDLPFVVLPSLVAAYGLWRLKKWGWVLALMISAIYLHSMTVLIAEALIKNSRGPMFFVSIYFLIFASASIAYLVGARTRFSSTGLAEHAGRRL